MTNFNRGTLVYKNGDITAPAAGGYKMLIQVCNNEGFMNAGVALAILKKWPKVKDSYRTWFLSQNKFALGEIQDVSVQSDVIVVNMIAQNGIGIDKNGKPPIRYDALEKCLTKVAVLAKDLGCNVVAPHGMGAGLAGGDFTVIENLIKKCLIEKGINVTFYKLEEK